MRTLLRIIIYRLEIFDYITDLSVVERTNMKRPFQIDRHRYANQMSNRRFFISALFNITLIEIKYDLKYLINAPDRLVVTCYSDCTVDVN